MKAVRFSITGEAQRILLAWLQGTMPTPLRDREAARIGGCSRATAFRALSEFEAFGLVERTRNGAEFATDAVADFRLLLPRLRCSPVRDELIAAISGDKA